MLTPFPDLFLERDGVYDKQALAVHEIFTDTRIPREVLIIAWAALLKGYTARDEVSFIVENDIVTVNTATWAIEERGQKTLNESEGSYTALSIETESDALAEEQPSATAEDGIKPHDNTGPSLAVHYTAANGRLAIKSRGAFPQEYTSIFGEQLQDEITKACELRTYTRANDMTKERNPENTKLSIINRKPNKLPGPQLLHHLAHSQYQGQDTALEYLNANDTIQHSTYDTLFQKVDSLSRMLSNLLRSQQVSATGHIVIPVLLPQSPELYIALLAVLQAGAAFCPLALDMPEERMQFIVEDVGASVLVTTSEFAMKLPEELGSKIAVCLVDEEDEGMHSLSSMFREPAPSDIAYVMYTSGSTGKPKGVLLSHLAVTQSLLAHDAEIPQYSRFLQFASPTFDVSMFEIFFTFFRGSTLIACERAKLLDDLVGVMNEMRVDAAELTPTVAGSLLCTREAVPGLRVLLTIGEMLTKAVVEEFGATDDMDSMLYGMYGPTECAIHCTLQAPFEANGKVGLIGKPLSTVSAFIVAAAADESTHAIEILPAGYIGELAAGGCQLASGYLNRPEQTAAAFVQHPTHGSVYRTGDKARLLPDGTIECLGRIQTGQVKLRGQRVELGEIEQAAARTPGCKHAVASVIDGSLVVFCLAREEHFATSNVLDVCRKWLPPYMLPSEIVLKDAFPRLPSGKADKKALEEEYRQSMQDDDLPNDSADELARSVCKIVSKFVDGQRVDEFSRLSKLGIDSIRAIRLASALRAESFTISTIDILKANTIASLCSTLRELQSSAPPYGGKAVDYSKLQQSVLQSSALSQYKDKIQEILPCTPLQASMLAETAKDPQAYCNWVELEFGADVALEAIFTAFSTLISANDILRTGFTITEDGPSGFVQVVWQAISEDCIEVVEQFTHDYKLDEHTLFHPLKVQVLNDNGQKRALIKLHHALYDGWSMDLLVEDLGTLMNNSIVQRRPQFSEVTKFYSSLDRQYLARDYWEHIMQEYQPTRFPGLSPYRVEPCLLSTATHTISLSAEKLRDSVDASLHPQVIVQAALSYLLQAYTGNTDVCFGVVTAGRTIPVTRIEDIIGPVLATLPLRTVVSSELIVSDLVSNIHERNRAILEHCTLPLNEIKRLSNVDRGPLFDVLFVWQQSTVETRESNGTVRIVNSQDFLEFDLVIEVEPLTEGLRLRANYRESLIPAAHIKVFLQQLDALVHHIPINMHSTVDDLSKALTGGLLSIENADYSHKEQRSSLATCVEKHAKDQPEARAVNIVGLVKGHLAELESLSYRQLNENANRVAHLLINDHDIKPNDLVGIFMEKSVDLYISILAVIKAGAAYLPLNVTTPMSRVERIFVDAQVRVCLSRHDSPDYIKDLHAVNVLAVDTVDLTVYSHNNPDLPFVPDDLAYAVFTSGSTGQPKGVLCTQQNLASNIETLAEIYPSSPQSKLLQSCNPAFDVSVFEIFWTWYSGMCIVTSTNDVLYRDLEQFIRYANITHLSLTPTVAALVSPDNVPSVEFLVTAGEAVTELVFRRWAGRGLFQGYGPSETTNIDTVNPGVTPQHAINNIGRPLSNTSAFVLADGHDINALPRGAVGELAFGGEQVFRGYLNMPELTASKVIDHPQYGRVYRSGDVGRLLHDGTILISGRLDDQVKIRGQRIELGEINSIIMSSEHVQDCLSLAVKPSEGGAERLVSFWVSKSAKEANVATCELDDQILGELRHLHADLVTNLPSYMLPSALVPVTRLPMTNQSKVDKRLLLSLYHELDCEYLHRVSPGSDLEEDADDWTELEIQVARTVAESKGISTGEVKRHTSFFSLGIDSISAIALARKLRSTVQQEITVSTILRYSSIVKLAAKLEQTDPEVAGERLFDVTHFFSEEETNQIGEGFGARGLEIVTILPCTPLQEALLSSSEQYHEHTIFEITGEVDRLRHAIESMCVRHNILRTCFVTTNSSRFTYAQVVLREFAFKWDIVQLEDSLDSFIERTTTTTSPAVDTFKPPSNVLQIESDGKTYLMFSMHHAIYDGVAMSQLLNEIESTYRNQILPATIAFEPVLQEILSSDRLRADAYWDRLLRDYVTLQFPIMISDAAKETDQRSQFVTTSTLGTPYSAIQEAGHKLSVTPLAIFQAAWAKLLSICLDDYDVCFGNVVSGRSLPIDGIERLIAPCFNTIPVRIAVSANSTSSAIIQTLQRTNVDSLRHQFTPLRRIQSRWSELGEQLFDTLFILQSPSRGLDDTIWTLEHEVGGMGYPVVCEVVPNVDEDIVRLNIHVEQSGIGLEVTLALCEAFGDVVKSFVEWPYATFLDIKLPQTEALAEKHSMTSLVHGKAINVRELQLILRQSLPGIKLLLTEPLSVGTRGVDLYVILQDGHDTPANLEKISKLLQNLLPENAAYQVLAISQKDFASDTSLSRKAIKQTLLDHKRREMQQAEIENSAKPVDDEVEMDIMKAFSMTSDVPLKQITRHKSIYQLGIDSISTIQVAKLLRNKGYTVSAQDVLSNPTATTLAKRIRVSLDGDEATTEPLFDFERFNSLYKAPLCARYNLVPEDVNIVRPCTAFQAGLLSQFLHKEGKTYFNHSIYKLQTDIDLQRLRNAWQSVVDKHEMLRTGFAQVDDATYPFAMITYGFLDVSTHYNVFEKSTDCVGALQQRRSGLAKDVFEMLHGPAWHILVAVDERAPYLQISAHHALYDAESMRMIMRDVSCAYNSDTLQDSPSFEPLVSNMLETAKDEQHKHENFWKETLKDIGHNKFPIMTPLRVASRTVCMERHASSHLVADLESKCREHNATLQAVLQVAWSEMVAAYIGETDITIGIVLSGRDANDADAVAFPTTTTIPYRCLIGDDPNVMLKNAMSFNSSIRSHQHSSLTQIQRWAGQPKASLFDTIFVFQRGDEAVKGDHLFHLIDDEATVEYPVSMEIQPQNDGRLKFQLVFWDDVLPAEQAILLLKQFDAQIGKLLNLRECSDTSSKTELLSQLPSKCPTVPSGCATLHALFEATVDRYPDRIALEWVPDMEDTSTIQRWTYQALEKDANRLAHLLTAKGASPGSMVAICFDKCPQASIAFLAILKAGCSFVALDPGAPVARKEFIVKDSDAKLLLSMSSLYDALRGDVKVEVVYLDKTSTEEQTNRRPSPDIDPQSTSYCLYTSGSTGTPKGCLLSHENAVQAMLAFQRLFAGRWDEHSRWLQFASFHFDVSVLEMFWTWSVAICLVSTPRDVLFQDLAGSLNRLGITHIDLTPSLARLITPEDVPSLCKGVFITGGEQLKQEVLDAWGKEECIHNGYGPTETSIGCTMYTRVPANGRPSNIGRQFDNVGTYVLKPGTNEIVPRGAVGELCVSGKLVGKGYLNRQEQTEKSFPFVEDFGGRIYRTSDLVRLLHDDTFDFLGRSDDQVKLRGQRIELGEINAVIQTVEGVEEVTTQVVKPSQSRGDQLVAFIVEERRKSRESVDPILSTQNYDLTEKAKRACQEHLPGYMIPTHLVMVNRLPLTVNNKSDTKALKQVYHDFIGAVQNTEVSSHTMTAQESSIADVLAATFSTSRKDISASSNIFQLGLDSIAVFAFTRALQRAGMHSARPAVIMQSSTIGGLAKALAKNDSVEGASVVSAKQTIAACHQRYQGRASTELKVESRQIEAVVPCTALQQGMIARSLEKGEGLYFNTFNYQLRHDVDTERLQAAWAETQKNVAILRTCFIATDEGHVQVVLKERALPYTEKWMTGNSDVSRESDLVKKDWIEQNMDHIVMPCQIVILKNNYKKYMLLNIFHGLYDATSLPLLLQKVNMVYTRTEGITYGPAFHDVLPYGPLKLVDGAKSFWLDKLNRAPLAPLSAPMEQVGSVSAKLALAGLSRFEPVRRQLNVTHQALVQTCWMIVLQRYLGVPTTIGTVVSGRSINYPGAELTIGPMFNTIPFYVSMEGNDTWETIARKCHQFNVDTLPYQHTPLRDIVKWCRRQAPLFYSLFVFQKSTSDSSPTSNPLWEEIDGESQADYPMSFEAVQSAENTLQLTLVAQSGTADVEACEAILSDFEETLQAFLSDPKASAFEHITWSTQGFDNENHIKNAENNMEEHFDWDTEALTLRNEIAQTANVEAELVGAKTSIFELGLDSIDAIKLSSRLKRHGINLKVSMIMRQRNIVNMSKYLENTTTTTPPDATAQMFKQVEEGIKAQAERSKLDMSKISRVLPCTPLQEGILADMLASDYRNYFNHDVLLLNKNTDLSQLKRAWQTVISRSPILRTSFIAIDQPDIDVAFAQLEHAEHSDAWEEMVLSADEEFDRVYENARQRARSTSAPTVPLRMTIVRKGVDRYIVLSMSHALYDGWSIALLHDDVRKAYQGRLEDRSDHVDGLKAILTQGTGAEANSFWQSVVSNATTALMPETMPESANHHSIAHRAERESSMNIQDIEQFCRQQSITLQALGQLCWIYTLALYTKSLDVAFGLVLSGRGDEESQRILFPTMNTVVVRSVIHGTNSEMLKYTQNNLTDLMQYQHFPLRKIKALAGSGGNELFNTLFIFQKVPKAEEQAADELYTSSQGSSSVEYPVAVEMEVVDGKLIWRTACQSTYLSMNAACDMLPQIDAVLKHIIAQPDAHAFTNEGNEITVCQLPSFIQADKGIHTPHHNEERAENSDVASTVWSSTEQAVREALSLMSGVPQSDIFKHQTIFHLGLDSISAIKVVSYLWKKKSLQVNVSTMLKAGSVEKLAAAIDEARSNKEQVKDEARSATNIIQEALEDVPVDSMLKEHGLEANNVEAILPASSTQTYFLSTWQNSHGELFYPTFHYRLTGPFSISNVEKAWQRLVAEQAMLRTIFVATGRRDMPFLQYILRNVDGSFNESNGDDATFSTTHAPASLRAQQQEDHIALQLTIHHALYDAVSLVLLMQELQNICNDSATSICSSSDVKALAISQISNTSSAIRKEFWTSYLCDTHFDATNRGTSTWTPHEPRTVIYKPAIFNEPAQLNPLLRAHGITFQSLFLAAIAYCYAQDSNTTSTSSTADTILSIYLANRASNPAITAPTLRIVPLRIRTLKPDDGAGLSSHICDHPTLLFETAKQIQVDLERIGAQEVIGAGLWEIEEWTGVKIDLFVNFLVDFELVEDDDHDNDDHAAGSESSGPNVGIRIEPFEQDNDDTMGKKETGKTNEAAETNISFQDPAILTQNVVQGSFPPSIDIEAAIRNNALDVGVFGPANLITDDRANRLIHAICSILQALNPSDQSQAFEDSLGSTTQTIEERDDGWQRPTRFGGQITMSSSAEMESDDDEDYQQVVQQMVSLQPRVRSTRSIWPRPLSVLFGGWRS